MAYRIRFYGRDFTPIDNDLDKTNPDFFGWELSIEEKKNILLMFLDRVQAQAGSLIVNKRTNDYRPLISIFNNTYYYNGIVGVISKKIDLYKSDIKKNPLRNEDNTKWSDVEITLQIQSRFDIIDNLGTFGKPFFLSTMLMVESNIKLNDDSIPLNLSDIMFDYLLLFSFKQKFKEAYIKGYYRTYHRFEKNDDRLRGTIDISRHIKTNLGLNNGKIAYSYKEKTINNYLNHLIVAAYILLKRKYFNLVNSVFDSDSELRGIMGNLIESINYPLYDNKTIIMKNLKPISHPFYTEYEALRKVSVKILRNESASIFNGDYDNRTEGILYYIPDLWEKYLERFIKNENYYLVAQDKIHIFDYYNNHNYVEKTFPDYVFYSDAAKDTPFMILDAKFKEKWNMIFSNSSLSDVIDDYNKCIRDMNSLSIHTTGVIFPSNDIRAMTPESYIEHNVSSFNKLDKFLTFPIYVPYTTIEYTEWEREFKNNCERISRLITEYCLREKEFVLEISDIKRELLSHR